MWISGSFCGRSFRVHSQCVEGPGQMMPGKEGKGGGMGRDGYDLCGGV